MDSQNSKINILIIGATGRIGSFVTKHCLNHQNLIVNILVRDPQKTKELTAQVESAGGKVFKGDVTQPETLKHASKGMHTVIMTLSSHPEGVIVDGQKAVIDACVENKVERIVPSSFSGDHSEFSLEETKSFSHINGKMKVEQYLKGLPIKTLTINTGNFIDTFFQFLTAKGFTYWGNEDHKFQMTTFDDTGRLVAAAVAKKDRAGDLAFVTNEVSIKEAADIYNKVRGADVVAKRLGSLEELKEKAEQLEKQGDPSAMFLRLLGLLNDSRIKLKSLNNEEFPEVKATSIEEFLKQRPDIIAK